MAKYIAVDLGASNGRVIAGDLNSFEVVNRFETKNEYINGSYFWDIMYIFSEIKKGIKEAWKLFPEQIKSIGIDTWGVDYALLDKSGRLIGNPFMYRDHRTDDIMEEVFRIIPKDELYKNRNTVCSIQYHLSALFRQKEQSAAAGCSCTLPFHPGSFKLLALGYYC